MNHLKAIEKVLKYLGYTLDYGQYCASYPRVLEGYSDAYQISNTKISKSTNRYVFTLGGVIMS